MPLIWKWNHLKILSLLGDLKLKYKFRPSHVFNVDQTGISTDANKLSQINWFEKEEETWHSFNSWKRNNYSCNTAGEYVSTLLFFPKSKKELRPLELSTSLNNHGPFSLWMDASSIFCHIWFDHFLKLEVKAQNYLVLLILDKYASFIKNIALLEKASKNNVHVFTCIYSPHITMIAATGCFIYVTLRHILFPRR